MCFCVSLGHAIPVFLAFVVLDFVPQYQPKRLSEKNSKITHFVSGGM